MSTDSKESETNRWCEAWEQDTKARVLQTTYTEYACQRSIEQNGDWEEIGSSSLHPALLCRTVPGGLLAEQHTTQLKLADLPRVLGRTSSSLLGGPGLIVSLLSLHSLPPLARQLQFPHGRDLCKGPTPSQDGTASKATIRMDRKGNPQRPARKMAYVSPGKEDPELDWDTCNLCCWRSSHSQREAMALPAPRSTRQTQGQPQHC